MTLLGDRRVRRSRDQHDVPGERVAERAPLACAQAAATEAHVDHDRAPTSGVHERGDHARAGEIALLHDQAAVEPGSCDAGAVVGRRARETPDVGAVADLVAGALGCAVEVPGGCDLPGQLGVVRVDAESRSLRPAPRGRCSGPRRQGTPGDAGTTGTPDRRRSRRAATWRDRWGPASGCGGIRARRPSRGDPAAVAPRGRRWSPPLPGAPSARRPRAPRGPHAAGRGGRSPPAPASVTDAVAPCGGRSSNTRARPVVDACATGAGKAITSSAARAA